MSATEMQDHARPTGPAAPAATPAPGGRPPRTAGPLLAVCGLCGGAGASTIAFLVARHAARDAGHPVLVCDTGGPTGGLAAAARVGATRSMPRTAAAVAAHEPPAGGLFADAGDGLRVMAGAPEPPVDADPAAVARVLADARAAHRLTVVDCGVPGGAVAAQVLAAASHLAWVLPATASGVRRAAAVLPLFPPDAGRREVLVARRDAAGAPVAQRELQALAAERGAPVRLVPHLPDLAEESPDKALDLAGEALDAIVAEVLR